MSTNPDEPAKLRRALLDMAAGLVEIAAAVDRLASGGPGRREMAGARERVANGLGRVTQAIATLTNDV